MPKTKATDLDYACEAQAAERAAAWSQAAALWRVAAERFPKHPCARKAADRDQYLANARVCDRRADAERALQKIAADILCISLGREVPTDRAKLRIGSVRLALRAAYEAGRQAERAADKEAHDDSECDAGLDLH